MMYRTAAPLILLMALTTTSTVQAQTLPAIKATNGNAVASCATPGRMMAFIKQRNQNLDARFEGIATEYMRHGEQLGVRWDYAMFQMMLETGNLSYRRGNGKPGDVHPSQYNFAGMGATGRGEPGERFPDLSTGVRAHLQHLQLYAGEYVSNPVAERTRKVQDWGVLTSWQKSIKGPMTFGELARKWAPGDRSYGRNIAAIAQAFSETQCGRPDPNPELVAEARGIHGKTEAKAVVASASKPDSDKVSGADLARRAIQEGRAERTQRSSLGASGLARQGADSIAAASSGIAHEAPATEAAPVTTVAAAASAAAAAAPAAPSKATAAKCRVYTASYGGQKAIIIKAASDDYVNYTVLDVNEGAEKREAEAYIAAYAKGGQAMGEFANQTRALDKAFELCPEG